MAHNPGTSLANVYTTENQLRITFSFTLVDIETSVAIENNKNNIFSSDEFNDAYPYLFQLFSKGVSVYVEDQLQVADTIEMSIESNENLVLDIVYDVHDEKFFKLSLPVLKQLPRGHRTYLQYNNHGITSQYVLSANSIPIDLNITTSTTENLKTTFKAYFRQGIDHIFLGIDHILFLVTLLLPALLINKGSHSKDSENLKSCLIDVIKIVTAFTIAHSITLGLALYHIVQLPNRLTEVAIAFSIIICAIHNLRPILPAARWALAFSFGLVHGFGFADALKALGVTSQDAILPLLSFNLGIETGQLSIIIVIVPVLYLVRNSSGFIFWIYKGGSMATILIASVWMIERAI